jgi:hypothetical protein
VVRLGLLQGFQLECCENSVDLPLGSQRVLAFLAMQARSLSRSYIASILWMDCNEERAGARLRSALWRINRSGQRLVAANSQVLGLVPDVVVDLRENARTAREVLRSEVPTKDSCVEELTVAGDLLLGWYDEWWSSSANASVSCASMPLRGCAGSLRRLGGSARRSRRALRLCLVSLSATVPTGYLLAYPEEGNRGESIRQYEACRQILRRAAHRPVARHAGPAPPPS